MLQMLYAFHTNDNKNLQQAEKELFYSINKSFELYHYLLLLIIDIKQFAINKVEIGKAKFNYNKDEISRLERFVNNKVFKIIEENKNYIKFLNDNKLSWVNYSKLIKNIFNSLSDLKQYNYYVEKKETSFNEDKKLIIDIFTYKIASSEDVFNALEEQSIYWNDDIEFIISMINKTIISFKENQENEAELARIFKNNDDLEFVKTLFRKCTINHTKNSELIKQQTKNWELERIAFMDLLIMEMAITEATEMETIPIKVTLNEYIEISKFYSTDKSSNFINGILDKLFLKLKSENKILKKGRGLIGENIHNN